jgi:hypothetical protein
MIKILLANTDYICTLNALMLRALFVMDVLRMSFVESKMRFDFILCIHNKMKVIKVFLRI